MMVSQGSVAVSLRCGGDHIVAYFVLSLAVKEFWKLINILQSYLHEFGVMFFLTQGVDSSRINRVALLYSLYFVNMCFPVSISYILGIF